MLQLNNIIKTYVSGAESVEALKGVDLEFRKSEFVSILGQSGCGKTTLLNIIGGLDRYTAGDLVINGKSTKTFKDSDWDTYRNHSIGFVFQSYNLIPHQTVLANVELALTLSGVSKTERRQRALAALESVGLSDQVNKKPTQMSGGQMQRVAIARALVNNPDILLADEPTGALDTKTSVQIMEILKEVAKDRLVIMVTHNPDLAEEYSTRIVRLRDGLVVSDSNPYDSTAEAQIDGSTAAPVVEVKVKKKKAPKAKTEKKPRMSFFTALSLSMNNLFTKKGRTAMTSFAGSIGIIGIALILSLSNGIQLFINQVQEDTLSSYPLTIQKETQDLSAMLAAMTSTSESADYSNSGMIYVDDSLGTMMSAMTSTVENNLEAFKQHLDAHKDELDDYVSDIQYTYDYNLQIYNTANGTVKVGMETMFEHMGSAFSGMTEMMEMGGSSVSVFSEMINNQVLLDQQYEVVAGNWPSVDATDEVVLVINSNNQISKMTLYMLGILDPNNIDKEMSDLMSGNYEPEDLPPYSYDDILNMSFKLLTTADFYQKNSDPSKGYTVNDKHYSSWNDIREYPGYDQAEFVSENGIDIKIVGIIRPRKGATATSISGAVGYTKALTDYILEKNANSEVINQQKETPEYNVLTGLKFERTHYTPETIDQLIAKIDNATMDMFYSYMTEQILTNEEFAGRIEVKDTESFLGVYMLLPPENQAQILSAVLDIVSADPVSAGYADKLLEIVSMSTGDMQQGGVDKIDINRYNFVKLLPSVDTKTVMLAFMGLQKSEQVPMSMPGLIELAGEEKMSAIYEKMTADIKTMTVNKDIFVTILSTMTEDDPAFVQLEATLYGMAPGIDATYDSVLEELDDAEKASPASVNFYAKDFDSKEFIEGFIDDYNKSVDEKDKLQYTDIIGTLMSSVSTIINVISYVLIAFVAISLVVSSIMIGIITNISVLERTKEIGILRAIGASKKDVSRVFNAETFIIGSCAGVLGILITLLLCIPANAIVQALTGFDNIKAVLPVAAAFILIGISMLLTIVAGLIPSRSAANKDPVEALRSE